MLHRLVVVAANPFAIAVEVVTSRHPRGEPDIDLLAITDRCEARIAHVLTAGAGEPLRVKFLERVVQFLLKLVASLLTGLYPVTPDVLRAQLGPLRRQQGNFLAGRIGVSLILTERIEVTVGPDPQHLPVFLIKAKQLMRFTEHEYFVSYDNRPAWPRRSTGVSPGAGQSSFPGDILLLVALRGVREEYGYPKPLRIVRTDFE